MTSLLGPVLTWARILGRKQDLPLVNIALVLYLSFHLSSLCFSSHNLCEYSFKLTNRGQRSHRMFWKTDGLYPGKSFLPPISPHKQKDSQRRGSLLSTNRENPALSLSPSRVELFPGDSVDMVLTASSDSPKVKLFAFRL